MIEIEKAIEEAKSELLPFESWERLPGETGAAFSAFCVYRDLGLDRNIRKAVESVEKDEVIRVKRYRVWRNWSMQFRWQERAADYDKYLEKLKQGELRKTIEAQGEMHRTVTGKMLEVAKKKLDAMNPQDLSQGTLTEWVQTAIKAEREAWPFADANGLGVSTSRNSTPIQGELNFVSDFNGI